MKRIAILTDGESPVSDRMMESLNHGSRYSVGKVPAEIASDTYENLAAALKEEGVDFLLIEGYSRELPADFPISGMIVDDEDFITATRKLTEACPDYGPEHKWAATLGETFDESRTVPPPPPAAAEQPQNPATGQIPQPPVMLRPTIQPTIAQGNRAGFANTKPMPGTYLIWSILVTILFCFIPGIIAIVFSTSVSSRYYAGDYEGAEKASRNAQIWIIVSIVIGCVTNTLYLPLMLLGSLGL